MTASSSSSARGQFAGNAALVHHQRPVGHADDLFHLARCKQDRNAPAGQLIHQFINFFLRAHIDPARRFIEQQQLRIQAKPLAEHDLLLIAARKEPHDLPIAGRFDPHQANHVGGHFVFCSAVEKAAKQPPLVASQAGERQVPLHAHRQHEPGPPAIFRGEHDAGRNRFAHGVAAADVARERSCHRRPPASRRTACLTARSALPRPGRLSPRFRRPAP